MSERSKGMTMNPTSKLVITLRSSKHDDPFAQQDSQYARDMKEFQSVAESLGGKLVPPRLAMDSVEIQTVLEFVQPLAHDAIEVIGAALVAWVHARAGRRTEVSGFGVSIKANSAEEAGQLLEKLSALKASQEPSD